MAGDSLRDAGQNLAQRGGSNEIRVLGVDSAGAVLASGTDGAGLTYAVVHQFPEIISCNFVDNRPGTTAHNQAGEQISVAHGNEEVYLEGVCTGVSLSWLKMMANTDGFWWRVGDYSGWETGYLRRMFHIGQFCRQKNLDRTAGNIHQFGWRFYPVKLHTATADTNGEGGYLWSTSVVTSIAAIAGVSDV